LPHAPQLALSDFVFAQYAAPPSPAAPQVVSEPHVRAHAPSLHAWPEAHAVPHAPQLALSVRASAQ
jgi:hypothetical protein